MDNKKILKILACPECKGDITVLTDDLYCKLCDTRYEVIDGVPLFLKEFNYSPSGNNVEEISYIKKFFKNVFPKVSLTKFSDTSFFDYVNSVMDDEIVLNLGSGVKRFDKFIKKEMINLDVAPNPSVHIVGDGHKLPIKNGSVGCVFSNAVLEHVAKPWIVADEIHRVLKDGGIVCVNVPFLNIVHESHDYYRFTQQGLNEIFYRFEEIKSGVSAGPSSFLTYFLPEYLSLFFPTKPLRTLVKDVLTGLIFPLKYMDFIIKRRDRLPIIADAVYFIGQKNG
jgi:uncharacterized protein YbaR (Trm112 family)